MGRGADKWYVASSKIIGGGAGPLILPLSTSMSLLKQSKEGGGQRVSCPLPKLLWAMAAPLGPLFLRLCLY